GRSLDWSSYDNLDVASFLRDVGMKRMRARGGEVAFCCPFHDDRVPSASMNRDTTEWYCHAGCGSGNAATFLARLVDCDTRQATWRLVKRSYRAEVPMGCCYQRKTTRTSGSFRDLEPEIEKALDLLGRGVGPTQVARTLVELFRIST